MRVIKSVLQIGVCGIIAFSLASCGSGASNNDQGVTFTLFGFFESIPTDPCDENPVLVSSGDLLIVAQQPENTVPSSRPVLGLQNNMSGQFIRTQRAYVNYVIPGATTQPPNTSVSVSRVIAPYVDDNDEESAGGFESSLPESFGDTESQCNIAYVGATLFPPEILNWINLNRTSLPEYPFTIIATVFVSGVSSAGNSIDTNSLEFAVTARDIEQEISGDDEDEDTEDGGETDTGEELL